MVNFPATSQEDRAAYAADHGTSSSFGAVESPARAPPYAAAAAVEQELCPQLSFGFDMDHPVTPPASPVLMPITPFQVRILPLLLSSLRGRARMLQCTQLSINDRQNSVAGKIIA